MCIGRLTISPRLRLVVSCVILAAVPASGRAATTYYVRKSGNDANNGKAKTAAFKTIDKARQVMVKGDVCYVGAGTYEETVRPTADGTGAEPIKYIGDTTGAQTGDSGAVILGAKNDFVISADRANYNEFYNFTIKRGSGFVLLPSGVYANSCTGLKLVNCTIENILVGVAADEGDVALTNCTIDDIWISPILTYKNDVTLTNTTIRGCSSYAAFHFALSDSNYLFKLVNCTIEDGEAGPYCLKTKLHLENTTIQNNDSWGAILVDSGLTLVNMSGGIKNNGGGLYLSKTSYPDLSGGIDSTDALPVDYTIADLDLSNNEDYGVHASNCIISLLNCKLENNEGYGLGLSYAELRDGTGTTIRNNGGGIVCWTEKNRRKVKITKAEVDSNTGPALVHYGEGKANDLVEIRDSNFHDNGGWSCHLDKGDLEAHNSRFERNQGGIQVTRPTNSSQLGRCELNQCTIDEITGADAVYVFYGDVLLSQCTISDVSGNGVQCHYGDVSVQQSSISGTGQGEGYAVYHYHPGPLSLSSPDLVLTNSSFTSGNGGIYAEKTNANFNNVDITGNSSWAIVLKYGSVIWTGTGATVVDNNGKGLYVLGNDHNSSSRTFTGWQFVDNEEYGIYAVDCSLVLENCVVERMTGSGMGLEHASFTPVNTPIRNNGQGITVISDAAHANPTITGAVVSNNTGAGILHESSDTQPGTLVLDNCTVTGNGSWGLSSSQGDVDVRNCSFTSNAQGIYLVRDPQIAGQGLHQFTNVTVRDVTAHDLVYAAGSSLSMTQCVLENGPLNGVMCYGENLTMQFCTVNNTGATSSYAVYHYHPADDPALRGDTVLDHCTITNNYAGPYGHNTDLHVASCTISGNRFWGLLSNQGSLAVDAEDRHISDNGYGLYLEGNSSPSGRVLENWTVTDNDTYGIYAVDCDLHLVDCVVEGMEQWGVGLVRSTLTTTNSPIRNNGAGIEITSTGSTRQPVLTNVEVLDNSGIGIQHHTEAADPATLVLSTCRIEGNGSYGLLSVDGNLTATSTIFTSNQRGLRLEKAAALAGQGGHTLTGTTIQQHAAEPGLYAEYATVLLTSCTVAGNAGHGVACYYADCQAEDSTFTGNGDTTGYGIFHLDQGPNREAWSELVVRNCSFSGNGGGVYADHSHLTVEQCTLEGSSSWAIGCAYGDLTFVNQAALQNNGSGLLVMGNTATGERRLTNFTASSNGNYGLFAVDCELVLENCQLTGMQNFALGLSDATLVASDTQIANNGNGIHVLTSATTRAPQLSGLTIANHTGYAVFHESDSTAPGTLTMQSCRLENYGEYGLVNMYGTVLLTDVVVVGNPGTSGSGIYCFRAPQVTAERIRVSHNQNWGLLSYGSNISVRNSVLCQNQSGAYVYSFSGEDSSASIAHVTFGENSVYGLVQQGGTCHVVNSIFATSTTGEAGLHVTEGAIHHSHNLFDGYTEPCVGTSLSGDDVRGSARFVNAAAGDFLLTGSSAAINRGMDLEGVVDQDLLGYSRPMFGKWDLGAYEYTSPSESAHVVEWKELK